MELYDFFAMKDSCYQAKKKIQNNFKVLLNVLQHDVENDENLTDDDYDLVSENKSESDN